MIEKKIRLQIFALRGAVISVMVIAALTLYGCSVMQLPDAAVTSGSLDTRTSVQYFSWLRSLSVEERQLEKLRLESLYQRNKVLNPVEGVQLALLLSTLKPADTDNLLLALSILTEVNSMELSIDDPLKTDYAEFARLWHSALLQHVSGQTISQERAGLIERLQERNLLLHNDNLQLREQNQMLLKQQTLLREEIHNLQMQIEALKEIEQQLNQREQLQVIP